MIRYASAAALFAVFVAAHADAPKIDRRISGLYIQQFKNENFVYIVDPYTQLCFAASYSGGGITEIFCDELKRRPGWDAVIRWTTPASATTAQPEPPPSP